MGSEGSGGHEMSVVCRKFIVSQSTGCSQPELLESLYQHFAQPGAWDVYPGAPEALKRIRSTGMPCHFQSLAHQAAAPPVQRMDSDVLHCCAYHYLPCASAWGECIPQALFKSYQLPRGMHPALLLCCPAYKGPLKMCACCRDQDGGGLKF